MTLSKTLFITLIAGLSSISCSVAYAEGSSMPSQAIGEKLNAAFGNQHLFNDIAFEFVDKSDASFSCRWWVMKASQQHNSDVIQINSAQQEYGAKAVPIVVAARQKYMMESMFPPLSEACNR